MISILLKGYYNSCAVYTGMVACHVASITTLLQNRYQQSDYYGYYGYYAFSILITMVTLHCFYYSIYP